MAQDPLASFPGGSAPTAGGPPAAADQTTNLVEDPAVAVDVARSSPAASAPTGPLATFPGAQPAGKPQQNWTVSPDEFIKAADRLPAEHAMGPEEKRFWSQSFPEMVESGKGVIPGLLKWATSAPKVHRESAILNATEQVDQEVLRNPTEYPMEQVRRSNERMRLRAIAKGPTAGEIMSSIGTELKNNPGKLGMTFLEGLALDPWMLAVPIGLGGSVATRAGAVAANVGPRAARAATFAGHVGETAAVGGAFGALSAGAENLGRSGEVSLEQLYGPTTIGAGAGGAIGAFVNRGALRAPRERSFGSDFVGPPVPEVIRLRQLFDTDNEFVGSLKGEATDAAVKPHIRQKSTPDQIGATVEEAPVTLPKLNDKAAVREWAKTHDLSLTDAYASVKKLRALEKQATEPKGEAPASDRRGTARLPDRAALTQSLDEINAARSAMLDDPAQAEALTELSTRAARISNELSDLRHIESQAEKVLQEHNYGRGRQRGAIGDMSNIPGNKPIDSDLIVKAKLTDFGGPDPSKWTALVRKNAADWIERVDAPRAKTDAERDRLLHAAKVIRGEVEQFYVKSRHQGGRSSPEALMTLGLATGGAAIGAAIDDDPRRGALTGAAGGLGLMVPFLGKGLSVPYQKGQSGAVKVPDLRWHAESGAVEAKQLARLATLGIGAAFGAYLDKDFPYWGAAKGALAGVVLATTSPAGIARRLKSLVSSDKRIRVNHLGDDHEYFITRGALEHYRLVESIVDKVPDAERRALIPRWLEGDTSVKLTESELVAAKQIREYFDTMKNVGFSEQVLDSALANYVTHVREQGTKVAMEDALFGYRGGPSMSPTTRFSEHRKDLRGIADLQGEVITDPAVIIGIYGASMTRAIANKRLLDGIKTMKAGPEGDFIVQGSAKAPEGYVSIDHPQFNGLKVHPDVENSLKFIFDTSDPLTVTKGIEAFNIATKRALVTFSLFHAKALTDAFVGAGGDLRKLGSIVRGEDKFLQGLRKHDPSIEPVIDLALKGGLKFSLERSTPIVEEYGMNFYGGLKSLQRVLDDAIPGMGIPVKGYEAMNRALDKFMWERLHAGMKLNVFSESIEQLIQSNAKAHARDPSIPLRSAEDLAGVASSYTNDVFGGLNWRRAAEEVNNKFLRDTAMEVFSPTGRRIMQIALFAPDWTFSTTRAMLRALYVGKGSGPRGILEPQNVVDLHRQYLIRSGVYYLTVADAMNVAMSGHHIWENQPHLARGQRPTWQDHLHAMSYIDMGDGRRMQWSKHTMEPVHWVSSPRQQFLNKLGVAPKELLSQVMGTKYLSAQGTAPKIEGFQERGAHLLSNVVPIGVQQAFDQGEGPGGLLAPMAGMAGFPIYGKTPEQKRDEATKRRLKKLREDREAAR